MCMLHYAASNSSLSLAADFSWGWYLAMLSVALQWIRKFWEEWWIGKDLQGVGIGRTDYCPIICLEGRRKATKAKCRLFPQALSRLRSGQYRWDLQFGPNVRKQWLICDFSRRVFKFFMVPRDIVLMFCADKASAVRGGRRYYSPAHGEVCELPSYLRNVLV
jgi:hypothetical protein